MNISAGLENIAAFKEAFRLHPAGVAVVSGSTPEGPVGLTLSSVASVSADPAVLSFSVTRATGSAGGILTAGTFVVNLLTEGQAEVAKSFAITGAERFTKEQGWSTLPSGEPYLPEAAAALKCTIRETVPVGPSVLVLANVLDIKIGTQNSPLMFRDRTFLSGKNLEPLNI